MENPTNETIYRVVRNHEDQHSIWPADRVIPAGWTEIGEPGTKADCLKYIAKVWPDITPKSARNESRSAPGRQSIPIKGLPSEPTG